MADSGEHRAVRERFSDTGEELMAVLRRQHVSHNTLIRVEAYLGAIMREHKAALAAQPSAEPGLHPDDADAKRRPIQTVGGVRVGAAALTPDRPTPRVGCFPQAHRYDRIGVTDRLRCRRCGFEKPG